MDWTPILGEEVIVRVGTTEETVGHVAADFGDEQPHPVDVNTVRIAQAARRWAINTHDGGLIFVDTIDLARPLRD